MNYFHYQFFHIKIYNNYVDYKLNKYHFLIVVDQVLFQKFDIHYLRFRFDINKAILMLNHNSLI